MASVTPRCGSLRGSSCTTVPTKEPLEVSHDDHQEQVDNRHPDAEDEKQGQDSCSYLRVPPDASSSKRVMASRTPPLSTAIPPPIQTGSHFTPS